MEHYGVFAEFYKLNIYSGPSGKFLAHVDTPRGPRHFGSLVICLPWPHQGGQLQVMHNGHEITYDWSNDNSTKIEWAAFYSDCKHEVFEVKSGHRVTLTYNLYISERTGSVIRFSYPVANPSMYPLHAKIRSLLQNPGFMKNDGTIGLYCTHSYAHTNSRSIDRLPYALKGVDAVVYAIFSTGFNLEVHLLPVLDNYLIKEAEERWEEDAVEYASDDEEFRGDIVGEDCHELSLNDRTNQDKSIAEIVEDDWPHTRRDIHWMNSSRHKEVAHIFMAYCNQSSLEWHYSALAILIQIPPFTERIELLQHINNEDTPTPQS